MLVKIISFALLGAALLIFGLTIFPDNAIAQSDSKAAVISAKINPSVQQDLSPDYDYKPQLTAASIEQMRAPAAIPQPVLQKDTPVRSGAYTVRPTDFAGFKGHEPSVKNQPGQTASNSIIRKIIPMPPAVQP